MIEIGSIEKKQDEFDYFIENTEGMVINKNLNKTNTGEISLYAFQKIKGLKMSPTIHNSTAYILNGKVTVYIDHKVSNISSGGVVFLPSNIASSFQGETFFEMLLVMNKDHQKKKQIS